MQYPATTTRLALGVILIAAAPGFGRGDQAVNILRDGGAEEAVSSSSSDVVAWRRAFIPSAGLRLSRDGENVRSGKRSLAIANEHAGEKPPSNNWAQNVGYIPASRTVQLSGQIRTEDADAVNICVQCWGKDGQQLIGFSSTPVFRKTHDWTFAQAPAIFVPPDTTALVVRAALTGKGRAWFDDLSLAIVGNPPADDPSLAATVKGRILKSSPVVQDCMILAGMPSWNHGDLDNIAVANNEGGVRTLLMWQTPPAEEAAPNQKFLLALYSRDTHFREKPGPIQFHEISSPWKELIGWEQQPPSDTQPALKFEMAPGSGWKLFDVTSIVRGHQSGLQKNHGVEIRFPDESAGGIIPPYSGYSFVSREAAGQWENRRPALLVVDPDQPPDLRPKSEPTTRPQSGSITMTSAELLDYLEYLASMPNVPIEDVLGASGAYMHAQDEANRASSAASQHGNAVGPQNMYVASQSALMPAYEAFISRYPLTPSGLQAMSLLATFYATVARHAEADRLAAAASRLSQDTDLECLTEINRAYVESAAGNKEAAEARLRRIMRRDLPLVDKDRRVNDILFDAPWRLARLLTEGKRYEEADGLYKDMLKKASDRLRRQPDAANVIHSYAGLAAQSRIDLMLDQNKDDAAIDEFIQEFSRLFPDFHDRYYPNESIAKTFERQIEHSRQMHQMQDASRNQPAAQPIQQSVGPDKSK